VLEQERTLDRDVVGGLRGQRSGPLAQTELERARLAHHLPFVAGGDQ
jgi:hypothetical protein